MSSLGTLRTHHLRPGFRKPDIGNFARTGTAHHFRPGFRFIPATPPPYLIDYAHFPVRLNGRAYDFASGASGQDGPPWKTAAQALTDTNGKRYYHAHSQQLLWTAGAGSRTITAHVRHTMLGALYPRLRVPARNDLGLAEQIATAGPETDTDHALALTFTMPQQATIMVLIENPSTEVDAYTTWGDILTE